MHSHVLNVIISIARIKMIVLKRSIANGAENIIQILFLKLNATSKNLNYNLKLIP